MNKTAIITGGAQGIGKAVCLEFANQGANVIIADIDEEKSKVLENEINKNGKRCAYIITDISNEVSIKQLVEQSIGHFGKIDILVNCAAKFIIKGLEASVEEWQEMFMTNVIGYALCAKYSAEQMKKSGQGSIVNIASTSGFIAQPEYLTYNTTKGALVNMVRCLALDLAPYNIRVNNVCPGTVWTENNAFHTGRQYNVDRHGADKHPEIGGKHVLNRVADPGEIAKAVLFLASDEASFITGENLMVDGGYTIV
ncbi:SDR family oxidoreductase [Paenibacillus sp. FSL H7-0716]|nr:SDR family oxidoreductase [Paenibacillus odorifer]